MPSKATLNATVDFYCNLHYNEYRNQKCTLYEVVRYQVDPTNLGLEVGGRYGPMFHLGLHYDQGPAPINTYLDQTIDLVQNLNQALQPEPRPGPATYQTGFT